MPKYNDKTDVTSMGIRDLASRLDSCVRRFSEVAAEMDECEIPTLELAVDTFRSTTIARLEAFSRTIERELLRRKDEKDRLSNETNAKMLLDAAIKKTTEYRKKPKTEK